MTGILDFEAITRLTAVGVPEGSRHDFKRDLPDALTLSKICCAFANSDGGALIFGVGQKEGKWIVEGLKRDSEFAAKFGQKVRVEPSLEYDQPTWVDIPGANLALAVVNIPKSDRRPHVPRQEHAHFLKRTGVGNEPMSLDEIRDQFRQTERRRIVFGLLAHELLESFKVIRSHNYSKTPQFEEDQFDVESVNLLFREAFPFLGTDVQTIQALAAVRRQMGRFNRRKDNVSSALVANYSSKNQEAAAAAVMNILGGMHDRLALALALLREKYSVEGIPANFEQYR